MHVESTGGALPSLSLLTAPYLCVEMKRAYASIDAYAPMTALGTGIKMCRNERNIRQQREWFGELTRFAMSAMFEAHTE
jgi:hypothetical protein